MEMTPYMDSLLWLGGTILFIVVEIFTAGFFFMFFAFGTAAAALVSLISHNYLLQGVVFILVSALALMFARPIVKNMFGVTGEPEFKSNSDALIDQEVLILSTVKKHEGRVKVVHTGETWSAYLDPASDVESIEVDQEGLVTKVDGAKLSIRPKPSE